MALTKISRGLLDTGVSDSSDATAITIDSSERVQIGSTGITSTIDSTFHAHQSVDGDAIYYLFNDTQSSSSSTNETTQLYLGWRDAATGIAVAPRIVAGKEGDFTTAGNADSFLAFHTSADNTLGEKVRITSAGNVGIGVNSTTAKLGVKNATNDSTYTNRQYAVFSHTGTYEDSDLGALVGTGFGELQINAAQGDWSPVLSLGGTLNAGELLGMINFYRSSNTDTYRCRAGIIAAGNNTGTANQYGGQLRFVTAADGGTNPSERMRIIQDGTVAIGTTISSNYGGGSLVVSSNNNFGITVGVNANNGYRTYRHVYSSGVHEFSSSANTASLSNAGAWTNASDRAYKKDIVDTQYGLDTILNLQPRDFTIKADESSDTGFIAQELETVLPQFVIGEEGHKNVNYAQITAVLTKAVQELKTELDAAKARIETLENA